MYGYTPIERKFLKYLTEMIIEKVLKPRIRIINAVSFDDSDLSEEMLAEKRITQDLIELLEIYGEDGFVEFGF